MAIESGPEQNRGPIVRERDARQGFRGRRTMQILTISLVLCLAFVLWFVSLGRDVSAPERPEPGGPPYVAPLPPPGTEPRPVQPVVPPAISPR